MAVLRQENWLGQQRVDIPHLRSIESGFVADMDVLAGLMLAEGQPLIIKGFDLIGSIGSVATALQVNVASASLIHYFATENGSIFAVPANRLPETLASTNTKVTGSFTPSSVNYIGLDLRRSVDNTTADLVQFLDANTLLEIPKTVPLARTLDYIISVSTSDFSSTPTIAPIAKVTTDAANNVVLIEDARQLFFRLGSGGSIPNRKNAYTWPQTKAENVTGNVFFGGDKSIVGLKSSLNAMMTRIWELGGGEYWYSGTADRNVKMFRSGMVLPNGEYFSWDGTNLTWRGLTFIFPNSSGLYNDVKDQLVALPGLTNLAEGECIYVDLDYSQTRTNPNGLQAVKTNTQLLGNPTIPGERNIVAWRLNNVIFTRDSYFPVGGLQIPPATTFSLGVVALSKAPTSALFPIVLTNTEKNAASGVAALDAIKNVIGAGLGRDTLLGNGVVTIGNSSRDRQILLQIAPGPDLVALSTNETSNPNTTPRYLQGWSANNSSVASMDNKGGFTTVRAQASNFTGQETSLTAGANGFTPVTLVGTGTGTIVPSGNSGTKNIYFVKIISAGGLGVGTFSLSRDGGFNYDATVTIPGGGIYRDPVSQVILTFAGSFIINDVYSFRSLYGPLAHFNDNQIQTHHVVDHSGFPMGRRSELREEWLEPNAYAATSSKWTTSITGAGFTAGIIDAGTTGTSGQLFRFPVPTLSIESNTNNANDQHFTITRGKIFYPQVMNVLDTTTLTSSFGNSVSEWENLTDVNTGNNSEYFMGWGDSILSGSPTAAIYFRRQNQNPWQTITIGGGITNVVTTTFSPSSVLNLPLRFRIETKNLFVPNTLQFVEDTTWPVLNNDEDIISLFNFTGGTTVWAGTSFGQTYYKQGVGAWTVKTPTSVDVPNDFWASSDNLNDAFLVMQKGAIDKFDGGMSLWTSSKNPFVNTFQMNDVRGINQNDVWAVGNGGKILHWNGEWAAATSPVTDDLLAIWVIAANDVWAVGDSVAIHWNGTAWTNFAVPAGEYACIWGAASNDIWAGDRSAGKNLIYWDGTSWTTITTAPHPVQSMWGFATNDIWIVGYGFAVTMIQHWDGTMWSSVTSPTAQAMYSIWGAAPNDIWAVGGNIAPFTIHWDGTNWSNGPIPPTFVSPLGKVTGFATNSVLVNGGGAYSVWNGAAWSAVIPTNNIGFTTAFWGSSIKALWTFVDSGEIFYGNHPSALPGPNHYQALRGIWGTDSTHIWTVGYVGRIFFFNGTSWAPVSTPTAEDLYSVWGVNQNDVWAVGKNGAIIRWNGTTWNTVASPTSYHLYDIWGTDATHIWAVGSQSVGTPPSQILFYDGVSWTIATTIAGVQLGRIAGISSSEIYFSSGPWDEQLDNKVVRFNGVSYVAIAPPLVLGVPIGATYISTIVGGILYLGGDDSVSPRKPHLFKLLTGPGYVNTARFFINENIVSEMTNNVPGIVPLKFMFGAKCGATNTIIRMQNSPLLIQIGRYTSTPQL